MGSVLVKAWPAPHCWKGVVLELWTLTSFDSTCSPDRACQEHPRVTREGKPQGPCPVLFHWMISQALWLPSRPSQQEYQAGKGQWAWQALRSATVPLLGRLTFQLKDVLCIQEALFLPVQ